MNADMEGSEKAMEFQVQCLTTANWPGYKQLKVQMSPQVENSFK
jgi:hypothetical protein